uniref:Uncharacterized protein n=1 Tax=Plectus sambesii TaxID=2011161 RepID=A0A914VKN3_9BILA
MLVRQKIAAVVRKGRSHADPLIVGICFFIFIVFMFGSAPIYSAEEKTAADEQTKQIKIPSSKIGLVDEDVSASDSGYLNKERASVARQAMGPCRPVHGKVTILVAVVTTSYERFYNVAQDSLRCYLKSTNYTFLLINLDTDKRVNEQCGHNQLFFKKHCAASVYLNDTDWLMVLDADAGVVNPNHCIEEWIDTRVDLIFYERFFNWEIASGNYIARNTPFAKHFLKTWADWQYEQPKNFNGADNGVLQIHILKAVLPSAVSEREACDRIWRRGDGYDTYMAYVTCVKVTLGATRLWPGKVRIYRRGHGWVRDGMLTADRWCQRDFMLHGWKHNRTGIAGWMSPFEKEFNIDECGIGEAGWHWRKDYRTSEENIKESLKNFERGAGINFPKVARVHPYLSEGDIGSCWPHCDDLV